MTEDQIRELFREMRDEPVPADSRARVRMAVAERSHSWLERMRRHWMIAAAVLVPALVALVMLVRRPAAPVVIQPVVAQAILPSVPETTVEAVEVPAAAPPRVVRARHRVVRPVPPAQAASLIRIDTPDPNVVILLIGG